MAKFNLNDNWYEIIDSESPTTSTFNNSSSSSVATFLIPNTDIIPFVQDVLGSATLKNNSFISREIPASSPLFYWQYASKIVSIKGYSPDGNLDAEALKQQTTYKNIQTNIPPYVGNYKFYKITVQFESRPYNVITDDQLFRYKEDKKYFLPTKIPFAVVGFEDEPFDYTDRKEYLRFTNIELEPYFDNLTWGNGNFQLVGGDNDDFDYAALPQAVSGLNNTIIPKYKLFFKWYFVPFEFSVLNKRWTDCYNKINQEAFTAKRGDVTFELFEKGSILFKKSEIKKYEPYYPFETINIGPNSSIFDYFTEYYKNQYCDITFECIYWDLSLATKLAADPATYKPLFCKDPDSMFNRLLNPVQQNWFYAETAVEKPIASPIFWSIPLQLLWTYQQGQ
jgi:hypothetical protein